MALNPDLIDFFLRSIQSAIRETFRSEVVHLFEHLDGEIKDNPVFDRYQKDRDKWKNWPDDVNEWHLPTQFEESKSLVYHLYRGIGENGDDLVLNLFYRSGGNFNTAIQEFNSQFIDYLNLVLKEIVIANPEIEGTGVERSNRNTVFIIHGHDSAFMNDVKLLLMTAGVNNIVLHEQPDRGRTIIDKLVEESSTSNYAIALLSPDDKQEDGSSRARQNVVLEIGYFIGLLGKERVRLLKKGDIEIPSDLQGILYEKYDDSGAWKVKLCKELIAVGIYADIEAVVQKF